MTLVSDVSSRMLTPVSAVGTLESVAGCALIFTHDGNSSLNTTVDRIRSIFTTFHVYDFSTFSFNRIRII